MKFNFDINKLITIGGIGLSAVGALLSSIANDKKMESAVEKKVEEASPFFTIGPVIFTNLALKI